MTPDDPGPCQKYASMARKHIAAPNEPGVKIEIRWRGSGLLQVGERKIPHRDPWSMSSAGLSEKNKGWAKERLGTRTASTAAPVKCRSRRRWRVPTKRLASCFYQLKTGHWQDSTLRGLDTSF